MPSHINQYRICGPMLLVARCGARSGASVVAGVAGSLSVVVVGAAAGAGGTGGVAICGDGGGVGTGGAIAAGVLATSTGAPATAGAATSVVGDAMTGAAGSFTTAGGPSTVVVPAAGADEIRARPDPPERNPIDER